MKSLVSVCRIMKSEKLVMDRMNTEDCRFDSAQRPVILLCEMSKI